MVVVFVVIALAVSTRPRRIFRNQRQDMKSELQCLMDTCLVWHRGLILQANAMAKAAVHGPAALSFIALATEDGSAAATTEARASCRADSSAYHDGPGACTPCAHTSSRLSAVTFSLPAYSTFWVIRRPHHANVSRRHAVRSAHCAYNLGVLYK